MQVEIDFCEPVKRSPPIGNLASRVWVAQSAGGPIGFLSAGGGGEISFVLVDAAHEGCGVAGLLIRAARTHFEKDDDVEGLTHGYPVSPKGQGLMRRYDIEGRPFPRNRPPNPVAWSDREATAKAQEVLDRILGYIAGESPLVPASQGVLIETLERREAGSQ
ncbi:hypothetical protein SAMN05660485_03646 [Blastococcus fimeti]|nr:hypothetical protein SAMN05660485_03646 [Blastococcus fimeti]